MKRIDSDTVSEDLYGAGKDGFTGGIPGQVPATRLTPEWCNQVQEEIAGLVEQEGFACDGSADNELAGAVGSVVATFTPEKTDGAAALAIRRRGHLGSSAALEAMYAGLVTAGKAGAAVSAAHTIDSPAMDDGIYQTVARVTVVRVGAPATFWMREYYVPYSVISGSASAYTASNREAQDETAPVSSVAFAGTSASFRCTVTLGAGAGTYNILVSWRFDVVTDD